MEPLKPQERARILSEQANVGAAEIDEYERLLAERFATDPDLPPTAESLNLSARREVRLAELYEKLFRQKVTATPGW
jgi:hypothetical protein